MQYGETDGDKMKTIKNGLVAAALALSGCCSTTMKQLPYEPIPSLYELTSWQAPGSVERAYLQDGIGRVDISFYREGYTIESYEGHYFEHSVSTGDKLNWGEVVYYNREGDDVVERIVVNNVEINDLDNYNINEKYRVLLIEINKDPIHAVWEERWR